MEPIDYFKYKALLAELNSNKDSKVGMTKFINKVYKLSQQLIFTNGFKESTRYAFILITKAIHFNRSIRKCPGIINGRLDSVSNSLINSTVITADNVLETYEFWKSSLKFIPNNLTDLNRIETILQTSLSTNSHIHLYTYNIKELYAFSGNIELLTKIYVLTTIGQESLILKYLKSACVFDESVISSLEATINNLQLILKETHEQHSRGVTTI